MFCEVCGTDKAAPVVIGGSGGGAAAKVNGYIDLTDEDAKVDGCINLTNEGEEMVRPFLSCCVCIA